MNISQHEESFSVSKRYILDFEAPEKDSRYGYKQKRRIPSNHDGTRFAFDGIYNPLWTSNEGQALGA